MGMTKYATSLSPQAQTALINAQPRVGAMVAAEPAIMTELRSLKLIRDLGLTRAGVVARDRILTARLDAAF